MEEPTSNHDSVTHSSPIMLFDGKTLVMDEMDFFADNNNNNKKNKNVFHDDEMLHQMELHVDVRNSFNLFLLFVLL